MKSPGRLGIRGTLWAGKHLVDSPVVCVHGDGSVGRQQLLLQGQPDCKSVSAPLEKFSDGYVLSWGMLRGTFPWEATSR